MSRKMTINCDECGSERKEVNRWTSVVSGDLRPQFLTFHEADEMHLGPHDFRRDYCSQKCVTSIFQRYLDTGSIEKPATTHDPDPDFNSSATLIEEKA